MRRILVVWACIVVLSGCATSKPLTASAELPRVASGQIQRGRQIWPVDTLANVLSLPGKLLLWNWSFSNHHITEKTVEHVHGFLDTERLESVRVRLNAYDPADDFRRLFRNSEVALPLRLLAFPFVLLNPFLGRFVGGIAVSDFYDPFSDTIYIYSDDPAIALHEAGHAKDYAKQSYKGLHAVSRLLPFLAITQEKRATDYAIQHYQLGGKTEDEIRAYKILYPAYFSYIGGILPVYPVGYAGAILIGHVYGRVIASRRRAEYMALEQRSSRSAA